MQPLKRQQFICSAIEQCKEIVNCCAHKQPHIKDERCVPRECRYAPKVENIDCDLYDPEHPRAPIPEPVAPVKTVAEVMQEKEHQAETTPIGGLEEEKKEIDIKEAVKKQASQRPVTTIKKKGRKS